MRAWLLIVVAWSTLAHADRRAVADILPRVRVVQDHADLAYRMSGGMTPATMGHVTSVVDEATLLLRDIGQHPRLSEDERGRLYEEILRGARGGGTRGSLARVFWASITHHGADDVEKDLRGGFEVFRQTFYEVFLDLKSLVTYRRDGEGTRIWTARDRYNREKIARALTVRFADLLFTLDASETRGDLALDYGYDAVHLVARTGVELRRQRAVAERVTAALYAGMVVANLVAPMILPFVQFDWVGLVTGGAWGSAPISGATYFVGYLGAGVGKLLTGTNKTYRMLRDLERVAADPGEDPAAKKRYQEFRRGVLAGDSALGAHRRAMMARGYRPGAAMTCAERLASAPL